MQVFNITAKRLMAPILQELVVMIKIFNFKKNFIIILAFLIFLSCAEEKNLGRFYSGEDLVTKNYNNDSIRIKVFSSANPTHSVTSVNPYISYRAIIPNQACSQLRLKVKVKSVVLDLQNGSTLRNSVNCESGDISFWGLDGTFYLFAEFDDENGESKASNHLKLRVTY